MKRRASAWAACTNAARAAKLASSMSANAAAAYHAAVERVAAAKTATKATDSTATHTPVNATCSLRSTSPYSLGALASMARRAPAPTRPLVASTTYTTTGAAGGCSLKVALSARPWDESRKSARAAVASTQGHTKSAGRNKASPAHVQADSMEPRPGIDPPHPGWEWAVAGVSRHSFGHAGKICTLA